MKIGKKDKSVKTRPEKNSSSKRMLIMVLIAITAVLIIWVYSMGKKAENTISVVMLAENVYKNESISESMLKEYQMLVGEFEKYAVVNNAGEKQRRIVKWDERDKLIGMFAAYPLQADTIAMKSDFLKFRIDNSDTVLYSFPGKNIVSLEVGEGDLSAFKTFLQPGDRINVVAIYSNTETVYKVNDLGEVEQEDVPVYRQEPMLTDVLLADLLNSSGDSILDMFAEYNSRSVYDQAALDSDEAWKSQTEPAQMLVALTPEEQTLYYQYLSKEGVKFRVSLPQRTE